MKKSLVPVLLASAAALFVLSSCGKQTENKQNASSAPAQKVIGIAIPAADHGWTGGVVYWANRAKADIEKQDPSAKVLIAAAASSGEQVDKIENLLVQGIQALVVLPNEPAPLTGICSKAAEKGVRLIVVDRGLTKNVETLYVAGDNRGFGARAAEVIAKELGGKGKIVVMEGIPCQTNTDRVEAFREVMKKYPDIEIMDSQTANWSTERGMTLMEAYLQKHPQIDAVWTGDDDVLLGALKAYENSKRSDVKLFVGGGGAKAIVKKILDGDPVVRLTVTYPPKMIYVAAQEALKILNGQMPEQKTLTVPAEVVEKSNAKDFYFPDSAY